MGAKGAQRLIAALGCFLCVCGAVHGFAARNMNAQKGVHSFGMMVGRGLNPGGELERSERVLLHDGPHYESWVKTYLPVIVSAGVIFFVCIYSCMCRIYCHPYLYRSTEVPVPVAPTQQREPSGLEVTKQVHIYCFSDGAKEVVFEKKSIET